MDASHHQGFLHLDVRNPQTSPWVGVRSNQPLHHSLSIIRGRKLNMYPNHLIQSLPGAWREPPECLARQQPILTLDI